MKEFHTITYELTSIPGFEGTRFTECSEKQLDWLQAVKFASDQNTVLQSVREAAAFRMEAKGEHGSDAFQLTRTYTVYFKDDGKFYVAFDDTPDPSKNIILARVNEGCNGTGAKWVLPRNDMHITQIVERARAGNRVIELADGPFELAKSSLELTTFTNAGGSEFGRNNTVQALFGNIAEPYAQLLHKGQRYRYSVFTRTPEQLNTLIDAQNALVDPLSYGNPWGILATDDGIGDYAGFKYSGRARGVYNPTEWRE